MSSRSAGCAGADVCRSVAHMSARPIRVALVNDHPLILEGVLGLLSPFADRVNVVELDSRLSVSQAVDVALFDAFAMDGPERPPLARLLADPRVARVLLYTWTTDAEQTELTLGQGVAGIVHKSATAEELVEALEAVHRGEVVTIGGAEVEKHRMKTWPGRAEGLTAREAEIVTLITMGYSNLDIAERTYLSINSVKSYIRTAYRTMGVTNRSRAILWGLDHGMRPSPERVLDADSDSASA